MDRETRNHLDRLLAAVADTRTRNRWRYYSGDHPKVYATPKLQQLFRTLADSLTENYCALAVQTRIDRLQITGWEGDSEPAAAVWEASRGPKRQDRLFRWALVHGTAHLLVDVEARTITANPATVAASWPDDEDPERLAVAGKAWRTEDGQRAALYYPDRTLRLADRGSGWAVVEEVPQPLGEVPVVTVSPYGDGPCLLDLIAPVQDRINKLTANHLVAAEFGAFRQRVFFTRQQVDAYDLRNAPDHAIVLDPGEAGEGAPRMQETSATDLANYDNAKNTAIDALFTIGQIPRHLRVNPGSPPSGDAIKADEGPLVHAVREHQREVGEALTAAMALLDVDAEPVWRDPEVDDTATNATVVATLVAAGVPWQYAVKAGAGWTDQEVAEAERAAAMPSTGSDVGAALLAAFDQANPVAG